jgi:hypothetical protein
MLDSFELLRKHLKDFLYFRAMRHIKILDPGMDIKGMSAGEEWDMDAMHPTCQNMSLCFQHDSHYLHTSKNVPGLTKWKRQKLV